MGFDRVFVVLEVTGGGEIISRGEKSDVTILAGQTNDIGTIDVHP